MSLLLGKPGSTSAEYDTTAEDAFKYQENDEDPWVSDDMDDGQPQTVWIEFPSAITPVKFAFNNRQDPEYDECDPEVFEFVGANDCSGGKDIAWEVIKRVEDVRWDNRGQERQWNVEEKYRKTFRCFGIRVHIITTDTPEYFGASLHNFRMWVEDGKCMFGWYSRSYIFYSFRWLVCAAIWALLI